MSTWPYILMVAALLTPLLLAQAGGGSSGSPPERSTKDAPSADQNVTFRVLGLMKTKSGATWMGWPNAVTKSLEGTKATTSIKWDYGKDLVTVGYDATKTTAEGLAKEITALGYKVEVVTDEPRPAGAKSEEEQRALVPDDAPKFFREAFAIARANKRPLIVDFWASWCGPCIRLKKETFADEKVAKLLEGIPVVFVDLDEYPALGEAYRVDSVPDVFLIDRDGFIVDRLHNFEPPAAFAKRLNKLKGKE